MKCNILKFYFLIFLAQFFSNEVHGYNIKGLVIDEINSHPVPNAIVRVQASNNKTITDSLGFFTLEFITIEDVVITAWKNGYFNGGLKLTKGQLKPIIYLKPVPTDDNKEYVWVSPDPPSILEKTYIVLGKVMANITKDENYLSRFANNCSNCHEKIVSQWRQDVHSNSAKNPILLTMYNGTNMAGKKGVFPGYKMDFPNSNGNCASCHVPTLAISNPWGTDINDIAGISEKGIFCDFCHKIKDVDIHPEGGYPGVLSIKLNRPHQGEQVFYGPFDDVIAGPDVYSQVYNESRMCAPCHSAKFWGVSIYSSFDEWLDSPYAVEGIECQTCHMAPDGETTQFAPLEEGGINRDSKTIATHNNPGSRNQKFMSEAIKMDLKVSFHDSILNVIVEITNEKAGHHYPTGVPMRNMILLVSTVDSLGNNLKQVEGPTVPNWGGIGLYEEGNFAGFPGKGFAKVLADISKEFPSVNKNYQYPTPHWKQSVVLKDNRIPAKGTDVSLFKFRMNNLKNTFLRISATLIYRRAFKPWIDKKGWPIKDMVIASIDYEYVINSNKNIH
tara:strand:+ start:491 stop:2161 length:1671 start_codon:yes stop_codon:yes gene_type:complete